MERNLVYTEENLYEENIGNNFEKTRENAR